MTAGRQNQGGPTEGGTRVRRARSDFGGVAGNLALLVALPAGTAYLYFCARVNDGRFMPGPRADLGAFVESLAPSWETAAVYLVWLVFQALLQAFAPGPMVEGTPLEDGGAGIRRRTRHGWVPRQGREGGPAFGSGAG